MARFLIVATAGAGGDLPPLIGAALRLRDRGHDTVFVGDRSVERTMAPLGVPVHVLAPELDLGPRLGGAIRSAMEATKGDLTAAGPLIESALEDWAAEAAGPVAEHLGRERPDAAVTSLFGVEVLQRSAPNCPWAVINSTFYVGPDPPRPVEQDIGPRAVPLLTRYARLLDAADLVLHATDQVFDCSFTGLPARHHYSGPLGVWEPPAAPPAYLDEPGDPWVLVSISSQLQDDIPLAEAALGALADQPVRVLLTIGPDHRAEEVAVRPANARIEQVVPHSAVLRRGVLLVSHAGHGSVMKALWEGRPMVLMPWGRDQPGVAARAQALGVAEVVARDGVGPSALSDAIRRVLQNEDMIRAAAQHAARLQRTDPPGVAAELLETLVR